METFLYKMKSLYKDMGRSEKRIADYLLSHPQSISEHTIKSLAKVSGSSVATAVRFSRRLGYKGFKELKIGMIKEMSSTSKIESEITKSDSCYEIFCKRIVDINTALSNTQSVLDEKNLETVAKAIMKAKRIVLFGLGNSASIAQDAAHKFMRLGLNAESCSDNHLQAIIASHLDRECVAIGISHSGKSKDIIEALQLSKIGSAFTVCITNYGDTPIVKAADIALFTKAEETSHSILALSSRIAQLAVFDAIYNYIVVNTDNASLNAIYNTEISLQQKKTN